MNNVETVRILEYRRGLRQWPPTSTIDLAVCGEGRNVDFKFTVGKRSNVDVDSTRSDTLEGE